jgi:hypothetical protein
MQASGSRCVPKKVPLLKRVADRKNLLHEDTSVGDEGRISPLDESESGVSIGGYVENI